MNYYSQHKLLYNLYYVIYIIYLYYIKIRIFDLNKFICKIMYFYVCEKTIYIYIYIYMYMDFYFYQKNYFLKNFNIAIYNRNL